MALFICTSSGGDNRAQDQPEIRRFATSSSRGTEPAPQLRERRLSCRSCWVMFSINYTEKFCSLASVYPFFFFFPFYLFVSLLYHINTQLKKECHVFYDLRIVLLDWMVKKKGHRNLVHMLAIMASGWWNFSYKLPEVYILLISIFFPTSLFLSLFHC